MSLRLKVALFIGSALGVSLVAACGGSSTGTNPPPTNPPASPTPAECIQSTVRRPLSSSRFPLRVVVRPVQTAGSGVVPGELAVRFVSEHHPIADIAMGKVGGQAMTEPNPQGWTMYKISDGVDPSSAASSLRAIPEVSDATPLHYRYPLAPPTVTPNDPALGNAGLIQPCGDTTTAVQWDMFVTNMPEAWAITEGSSAVTIAVIDTGVDLTHNDIMSKVALSTSFIAGVQGNAASVQDYDGHGTDVSGIAAADTSNGIDVAGVGWKTDLIVARVFPTPAVGATNSPGASSGDIALGINWAVKNKAKVINLSLGGSCPDDPTEEAAVEAAITAGVTVVAAAGNDGTNTLECPAADPGVISVGASALNDHFATGVPEVVASYSNFGNGLDVVAPGGDPTTAQVSACAASTNNCDFLQWIFNLYSNTSHIEGGGAPTVLIAGTSMSTPHVAGVAALMYFKDPSITPSVVRSTIDSTADNINDAKQGHGRLDAFNALNAIP